VPLGPAQVHALEVLREVGGVGPTGLRVDRDQRLARVVLAAQQGADLKAVDLLAERGEVADRLLAGVLPDLEVGLVVRELEQHPGVIETLAQASQSR